MISKGVKNFDFLVLILLPVFVMAVPSSTSFVSYQSTNLHPISTRVHQVSSIIITTSKSLVLGRSCSSFDRITQPLHRHSVSNHRVASPSLSSSLSSSSSLLMAATGLGKPICEYHQVTIPTSQPGGPKAQQKISVEDLTPQIQTLLKESGMTQGVITVISRHTTTAITINERETRLASDMENYFLSLAPPDERSHSTASQVGVRYYHNDIDQRPDSEHEAQRCRDNGWDIDNPQILQEWRNQEPMNAHSHLLSMLVGNSESIPVTEGSMVIGQWQSILLVDFDGPRDRTVGIQLLGYQ